MKRILFKWMFCLVAAMAMTMMFTACSDDDDDEGGNGNGQGAGNGGSGVTVLAKKVAKIVQTNDIEGTHTFTFSYDEQGRLSKIFINSEAEAYREYKYTENKISIYRGVRLISEITLKDGKAVSEKRIHSESFFDQYTYTYTDNYLSKMEETEYGDNEAFCKTITSLTLKNGNLVGMSYTEEYEDETDHGSTVVETSNIANNANIDFWGWVVDEDAYLLCVLGKRYQNLPSKLISTANEADGTVEIGTTTYTYVTDKDNYVTNITATDSSKEDGEDWEENTVYTITYE